MKKLSKISVLLLALLACSIFSCKKELAPLQVSPKPVTLSSSDYGLVTTVATGITASEGLAVDAAHNLYVGGEQIYKITPAGVKTLLAGGTDPGWKDGTGEEARFGGIWAMTFGPDSALYAVDAYNHVIRKITLCGVVTTIAGQPGVIGNHDGPAAEATFAYPSGITSCGEGNLYVAEYFNRDVRVITPDGKVYTLVSSVTLFSLAINKGVEADRSNLYFTDAGNYAVGKIAPDGTVSTFNAGVVASYPLAFDSSGNLYLADYIHFQIWKITPAGEASIVAGSGIMGSADGVGVNASFSHINGLAVDGDILYVAEHDSGLVRKVVIK